MCREIYKIVIYNCIVKGQNVRKSCVYYNDGSYTYGDYQSGIDATMELLKEKGLDSKTGMKQLVDEGIIKISTEEDFLKNKNLYEKEVKEVANSYFADIAVEANDSYKEEKQKEEIKEEVPADWYGYYDDPMDHVEDNTDDTSYDEEIEDEEMYYDDGEKIVVENWASYQEEEPKSNHLGLKIGAAVLGILIGAGLWASCNRRSKTGEMTDSNLPVDTTITTVSDDTINITPTIDNTSNTNTTNELVSGNNDLYNEYSYTELLEVTNNDFQKTAMINLGVSLNGFNGTFANNYTEAGNDIRAALKVDEAVALQQAYNTYSINEVRAYFNGSEIHAEDLTSAYKDASLQLMGAHVLETRENQVDMTSLIDSDEGKAFYNRYHEMFLAAKEATGSERTRLVNEFYDAVRADFPITSEVRTSGISHADDRTSLKDYQLAVTPMIAASEILFERVEGLNKLSTEEIDFLNDIGLCNHADDKFERIETIMLAAYEDNTNPLYEQYRNAIIKDLTDKNIYVIDNAHRELANLRSFQIKVNGNNNSLGRYTTMYSDTRFIDSTETYTETKTWTETHTETRTETDREERDIPDSERDRIDREIADDNNRNRTEAERQAEEERRRLQEEENRNSDRIRREVEEDDQDLQNRIDDANNRINNGERVNESDLGHGVNIDDNHSDNNGNINDSVHNITTNPEGANKPLPNPEDTEEEFNNRTLRVANYNSMIEESSDTIEEENTEEEKYVKEENTDNGVIYIVYDEEYPEFDENGELISNDTSKAKVYVYEK